MYAYRRATGYLRVKDERLANARFRFWPLSLSLSRLPTAYRPPPTANMEMSSPLAAMHPPPMPGPWGYRRDLPAKPLFGAHNLGPNSFNFRDMSMHSITNLKKGGSDYFNLKPLRGAASSPTTSLAADMSSNLHMDQRYNAAHSLACSLSTRPNNVLCHSPQLATPRRSLFTSNLLQQYDAPGTSQKAPASLRLASPRRANTAPQK